MRNLKHLLWFIFFYFFYKHYVRYRFKTKLFYNSKVNLKTTFEGRNVIQNNTSFLSSSIGYGSYIGKNCLFNFTQIGRFCSIGNDIKVIIATHPSHTYVSTHPCFYSTQKQAGFSFVGNDKFKEHIFFIEGEKIAIKIGNDVWISNNVILMAGIQIGDGAIIATGAVVTKDVPPYAIVAGVPAKIIRQRFDQEHISFLTNFKWWTNSIDWITENSSYFEDVEAFSKKFAK